jgi:hypothetical protein
MRIRRVNTMEELEAAKLVPQQSIQIDTERRNPILTDMTVGIYAQHFEENCFVTLDEVVYCAHGDNQISVVMIGELLPSVMQDMQEMMDAEDEQPSGDVIYDEPIPGSGNMH